MMDRGEHHLRILYSILNDEDDNVNQNKYDERLSELLVVTNDDDDDVN